MDFKQLSFNDHTLFHMVRHFESLSENGIKCLLNRGYTASDIELNHTMAGSKFYSLFANDIKTLVEQCSFGTIIQCQPRKKYQEIVLRFDENLFPNGIGTVGVCNKNDLSKLKASEPILKLNRGVSVLHATVSNLPKCSELTVVVKKQSSSYFLITAFPGLPALPLPHIKMNSQELELSKQYWSEQVFLE